MKEKIYIVSCGNAYTPKRFWDARLFTEPELTKYKVSQLEKYGVVHGSIREATQTEIKRGPLNKWPR